jgi:hypothetical protein
VRRRLPVWLLVAVPAGWAAASVARGASWLVWRVGALSLPGPLALVPGLLFLLLVLLLRAVAAAARPARDELAWIMFCAAVGSLAGVL